MPVQDNDDKRTADQPAVDAEEEFRGKQAQAQEQQQEESGAQKSGKLLPFLNAKAEHHQSRIDSIDEKIANQTDKIDRNKAKIEALSAKADKLEDTNRMLKATIGNLPGIRTIIANNEKRIQAIREVKIPKRQEKIDQGWKKIDTLTAKRDRIEHKLNRVIALNDTIKSFGIHFNKERREAFADAMTRLNSSTVDCLSDKKATLEAKRQDILDTYNAPETSAVDKLKLGEQLKGVNERIGALESKIMKLARPETRYEEQTNDQLDASMKLTGDNCFDVSPSRILLQSIPCSKTVTVTYRPDCVGDHEAVLTIYLIGGKARPLTIKLHGTATGQLNAVNNNDTQSLMNTPSGANGTTDVNELAMDSKVYANGLNIIIESPIEQSAIISDISGHAQRVNLQAGRNEIPVNASGIYIVGIREKTTKLLLK